ncbi:hypothetical protein D3C75_963020 [compost metagenome]
MYSVALDIFAKLPCCLLHLLAVRRDEANIRLTSCHFLPARKNLPFNDVQLPLIELALLFSLCHFPQVIARCSPVNQQWNIRVLFSRKSD